VAAGHSPRRCAPGSAGQQEDSRPVFRDNESKLQWIENESWEYRLNFDVTPRLLARSNVDLVFDGLDAAAQVYVNGARCWPRQHVPHLARAGEGHLHAGKNLLRVVFPSPIKAAKQWRRRSVAAEDEDRAKTYIRKAAYEYGWDWGPRL
jgi:beta-mannosidase